MHKPTPEILESGTLLTLPRFGSFVYRLYDAGGTLLYVGMAADVLRRLGDHMRHKSWWREVRRIDWEMYDTRDDAAWAERVQINALEPLHNIDGYWAPREASSL